MTAEQCKHAERLAALGIRLLPQGRNKKPAIKDWPTLATTDIAQIERWSVEFPSVNFAALCGEASGILVVDIDVKGTANGLLSWAEFSQNGSTPTLTTATPSGGKHLYFGWDERLDFTKFELLSGVEVVGNRQCVTVPGSFYSTGAEYRLESDAEIQPAPEWLVLAIVEKQAEKRSKKKRDNFHLGMLPRESGAIPEGERHGELLRIAGALRRGGADESALVASLLVENERCQPPFDTETIASLAKDVSERYDPAPAPFFRADVGNADRLIAEHGENIRFCYQVNRWYIWNGASWKPDENQRVNAKAEQTVRAMYRRAINIADPKEAKTEASWAISSLARQKLDAMVSISKYKAPVEFELLDADSMLLGAQNGYIDLSTGDLLDPDRSRYVTKLVPVDYDPNATAPRWCQFLSEVFDGEKAVIDFVQRCIGYALTGDTREQCFFLLHGRGRNGKSTLLEVLLELMGPYGRQTQPQTIMAARFDDVGPTPELAALAGARFLTTVETQENKRLNESLVKQLSGSESVSARRLYADVVTFKPQFKLFLATNYLPEIHDHSDAMWRRIRLIPFRVKFEGQADDKSLRAKLLAELEGILAWAVEGCLKWQAEGLEAPVEVVNATADYRVSQDPLGDFVDAVIEIASGIPTTKAELYNAYERWCKSNGENAVSQRKLSMELQGRGWTEKRLGESRTRAWSDVRIREEFRI